MATKIRENPKRFLSAKNALPGGSAFRRPCCERDNTRGLVDFLELKGIVGIAEPDRSFSAPKESAWPAPHGARRLGHRVRARAVAVDGSLRRSCHTAVAVVSDHVDRARMGADRQGSGHLAADLSQLARSVADEVGEQVSGSPRARPRGRPRAS